MSAIYIHIPFCRHACTYCDFHFSVNRSQQQKLVDAICNEITLRSDDFPIKPATLYFGGGTPSLLTNAQLDQIIQKLKLTTDLSNLQEVTIEANPEDINDDSAISWASHGVNRLSIGIQTFDDDLLQSLNRHHNAKQVKGAIETLRRIGIQNITGDLIFGLPGADLAHFRNDLEQLLALNLPHVSVYGLTIEEKTMLHKQVQQGMVHIHDELHGDMFLLAHELLCAAGFDHYEISNYAKPGYRSQHNSSYWNGKDYIGLGPSAHSYLLGNRYYLPASNAKYIREITAGHVPVKLEESRAYTKWNDMVITRLRTKEGITGENLEAFQSSYHWHLSKTRQNVPAEYLQPDALFALSPQGMLFADQVMLGLIL